MKRSVHRDQIWDKEESKWKHRNFERDLYLREVLKLKGKILEIGPGYGSVMKTAGAKNDVEMFGIDVSPNLVEKLIAKQLNVICGDALDMPFCDNFFDAVVCDQLLEHIVDQTKFMNEVKRVLKTNGTLIVMTPNKYIYRMLMYISNIKNGIFEFLLLKNPTPGHVGELSFEQLGLLAQKYFILERMEPVNVYLSPKILNKFKFLAIDSLLVAKKPLLHNGENDDFFISPQIL